jgi:hypothetical protein
MGSSSTKEEPTIPKWNFKDLTHKEIAKIKELTNGTTILITKIWK